MIRFFLCICKSVVENHYNLLYREDERELIPICKQMNVSLMPYSRLQQDTLQDRHGNPNL